MPEYEPSTLKLLRRCLVENAGDAKMPRISPENAEMRRRLDETLLSFRVARNAAGRGTDSGTGSWLRAVRQAVGVPVEVMARRLGVTKYEIFRLEKAERESRIVMSTLERAADALGCELVYALAPKDGSLEDLAVAERAGRERARADVYAKNEEAKRDAEGAIDWHSAIRQMFRREMRKLGLRVR